MGKKILIVEDDPMVALINKRFLENMGFKNILGPVQTEEEIIKVLDKENIDLILLDVYLPKKNGIDILKSLRYKKYLTDVIMITAANSVEEVKRAFAYGVTDYLVKPFEFERFEEAINKYKQKNNLLNKREALSQQDIDVISKSLEEKIELPKGLNQKTLDRIMEFLKENQGKVWTLREIAYELKISNVTIKKYMDYLEDVKKVNVTLTSGNVGRPEYKYTLG
ncbi:TPA: response regulator [Clostridium perfringens]|uniref:Transcriptional regulatory protein n=2 Tax=Clostridium perfringens TaxID=1502 RepID=A0AAN5ZNL7_CLOPF|nr:response regulator [Clostridium perfringens]ALG47913.1 Two-component response regulator, malate [Clostridium perfringens]EDT25081.1 response regulator [Clostridium perfringens B str. ATCC 3626]EDT27923.1 response regulator [Clostridium perfringens CPE str. F4969]EGT0681669.1 response regulator [Clostridium perfringens]EGT3602681.1 response regulator [Clostridium perfringens]